MDTLAPASAGSTDGMTRSMCAMALFNAAKEDYAALAEGDAAARSACHTKHAAACFRFAVDNGGVYIKAAQFVASLQGGAGEAGVPHEYIDALRPLTDTVPPRPFAAVAAVAEEELGKPLDELLESIAIAPVAAASLAQVHRAVSRAADGGVPVAVKIQYPSLAEQVAADFQVLRMMTTMIQPAGYDFGWLIADIEKYVTSELDFGTEAANAAAAAAALAPLAPGVLVPAPVAALSGRRVMTSVFIEGMIRLDDPVKLAAAMLDPMDVGAQTAAAFSELALVHGLVHGDPHAGNVYVRVGPGSAPSAFHAASQLVILDHGLYHRLTDADRLSICDLILACATPIPNWRAVRQHSTRFAGPLASLFPPLLSPAFALATGLSVRQLRAASAGQLPEGTTLDDVWKTLVAMHDGESDVLGLLHSLGYVRGLQNALRYPERERVLAFARCATRATCAARPSYLDALVGKAGRLSLALWLAETKVKALFLMLRVVGAVLACAGAGSAAATYTKVPDE